jgi:hypothetical protein
LIKESTEKQTEDIKQEFFISGEKDIYGNLGNWHTGLVNYEYPFDEWCRDLGMQGDYVLRLTVYDNEGNTSVDTKLVSVGYVITNAEGGNIISVDNKMKIIVDEHSLPNGFGIGVVDTVLWCDSAMALSDDNIGSTFPASSDDYAGTGPASQSYAGTSQNTPIYRLRSQKLETSKLVEIEYDLSGINTTDVSIGRYINDTFVKQSTEIKDNKAIIKIRNLKDIEYFCIMPNNYFESEQQITENITAPIIESNNYKSLVQYTFENGLQDWKNEHYEYGPGFDILMNTKQEKNHWLKAKKINRNLNCFESVIKLNIDIKII